MRKTLDHDSSSNKRHETQTGHFKRTDHGNSTDDVPLGAVGVSTTLKKPDKAIVAA